MGTFGRALIILFKSASSHINGFGGQVFVIVAYCSFCQAIFAVMASYVIAGVMSGFMGLVAITICSNDFYVGDSYGSILFNV